MGTAVSEVEQGVVAFSVTDEAIAHMKAEYMPLAITDVNDKRQFTAVSTARKVVKKHRVAVEKRRKELKASALEWGRKVDAGAKQLVALLEPIESHLQCEEDKVAAAKKAIEDEKRRKAEEKLNDRLAKLTALEHMVASDIVARMTDEKFAEVCEEAAKSQAEKKAEAERKAVAAKAEADRLAKERAELAKLRQEQEARDREAQRKLMEERKKIEAERRQVELEKAKAEAAENARIDTEDWIRREAAEAKAKEDDERKERVLLEALAPDREKIRTVANDVAGVTIPELSSDTGGVIIQHIRRLINHAAEDIRTIANDL